MIWRNWTFPLSVWWNVIIPQRRCIVSSLTNQRALFRCCNWMCFLRFDEILLTREGERIFCGLSLLDTNIPHSETLFVLIFNNILKIFISDLLASFIFVLIINFLNDASASIEVILTVSVVIQRWLIFGGMETFQNPKSTCISSFWR